MNELGYPINGDEIIRKGMEYFKRRNNLEKVESIPIPLAVGNAESIPIPVVIGDIELKEC